MSMFIMDFYNVESGVQFTLQWRNEEEYLLGKAFLRDLLGDDGSGARERGAVPFYYLKNDQVRDALLDFRRELREKTKA